MAEEVPAGWYPTPDGGHKYWDGTKWTALPWDGPSGSSSPKKPRKKLIGWIAIGAGVLLIVAAVFAGLSWKANVDAEQAAAVAAQEQADKDAAAAAAQAKADAAERAARKETVKGVEASIQTMAEGHAADGVIDGPIIDVSCSPLGGGSTDDLSEQTTVFECFVANVDNGDGTMSGYNYHATMNWSTGEYTYGLGAP